MITTPPVEAIARPVESTTNSEKETKLNIVGKVKDQPSPLSRVISSTFITPSRG